MRKGTFIVIGVVAVIFALLVCGVFTGMFTPAAPAGWSQVHAGMTRSQVIALAGTPQQSGWPEKVAETWYRDSFVSQRRLFIVYQGDRVRDVWDGTWVHGYGWSRPRRETI